MKETKACSSEYRIMERLLKRWLVTSLMPYAIYLVGYVFESRVPGRDMPIIRDQSLAFLPGEAGLALFVAAAEKVRPTSTARHIAGLLLGLVSFIVIRRVTYSPSDYSAQAWWSPTKLYHDVVICGLLFLYEVVYEFFGQLLLTDDHMVISIDVF